MFCFFVCSVKELKRGSWSGSALAHIRAVERVVTTEVQNIVRYVILGAFR